MIVTAKMVYLTAATLSEHAEAVAGELLRLGLLHFVRISDVVRDREAVPSGVVEETDINAGDETSAEARRRIEAVLSFGGFSRPVVGRDEVTPIRVEEIERATALADSLTAQIDQTREKQRALQQQINRLEDLQRHLPAGGAGLPREAATLGEGGSFLEIITGWIPRDRRESLEQKLALYPAVITPLSERGERLYFVLVAMKRNSADIGEILAAHGFTAERRDGDTGIETRETIDARLEALRGSRRELADSIPTLVAARREELEESWRTMRVRELMGSIRSSFAHTRRVAIISGWLPKTEQERVERSLTECTDGHIHIEWHQDREFFGSGVEAPSRLENPRVLSPFQTLVTNFGIPAYGTVDPTGLVAVAYLIMFGLMFGDVGHGLVILLAGVLGRVWSRRTAGAATATGGGGISAAIPLLSKLMLWCGVSAMVAGALFGSYFGFGWFPPLWFDYHGVVAGHVRAGPVESIFDVLVITIYFGVIVIGLGLVINWANLLRQRRWFPLIFDKAGVLGGVMYGTGVVAAAQFAASGFRTVPTGPAVLWPLLGPAIILFFKGPFERHSRNPLWWLMEWVIELLEIFSGYLANTLSFMRVAGLGIAHVTLMIAFYQIARMASPEGMNAVGVLILVVGNVIVIVLEGLSAGIQSLRLNYYEFFSKHFQPSGVPYTPVSLEVP